MSQPEQHSAAPPDMFEVRSRTHRRTALVELFGELDLATVPQVADAFDASLLTPMVCVTSFWTCGA
jgi:hypothetical protein